MSDDEIEKVNYDMAREYLSEGNIDAFVDLIQNNLTLGQSVLLIREREEQVELKASMQTQFFLMSDLLTEMSPLMVHRHEPGFPEMTAEIIGKVADWRNDKFDEAVKVVLPDRDETTHKGDTK